MASPHDDALAISQEMRGLRRAIHAEPEIGLALPRTQAKVLAALDGLPLEIATGRALSSVTAVLRGTAPASPAIPPTVVLRADMDALPVTERTTLEFASQIEGAMHACGHDLHTAMLAGAARILAARREEFGGNVIFMFQPGEEGYAGARLMLEEGLLDAAGTGQPPTAAFALHVASAILPLGLVASRPGPVLAAADTLRVTVRGRGGHGSRPQDAADPIPAACEIVTALQTMVTRRFDVFDPVVITVGSFHAGTTDNVIPDEAHFDATLRSFSATARQRLQENCLCVAREIGAAHAVETEARIDQGYPVTVNHQAELDFAARTATATLGPQRYQTMPNPLTGAEDFSYVLERVPGAMLMLGACPPSAEPATAPYNHSAHAVFDEGALADGAALYAEFALRRLSIP